jgi:monovalent cation:H+ antiporter-2, CPA2 family
MDQAHHFLQDLALVLCVAAVTTVVFQWLKQPVVLGYLLAGLIVGPHLPVPLVADTETIGTLAELGVILLMFSLGLDFNLRRLARVGLGVAFIALLEIGLMLSLGFTVARLLGWSVTVSLAAGAVVAISSTMIIVRAFKEQQVEGRLADLVYGVLVVEDLAAILILSAMSAVVTGQDANLVTLARTGGRLAAFLAGSMAIGLLVVPRVMRAVVSLRRHETTLVATIGICFAAALLARGAGFSVALGAFLAGSLVSESGVVRHIEPLVRPVRDMFAAIFFIAVGMLIDPRLVWEHRGPVLALAAVVIVGKIVGVTVGAFLAGYGTRTSVRAGMSMAQIGEFSFIIAGLGAQLGEQGRRLYPIAVAVSVVTAFTTPWLIRWSEPLALLVDRRLPHPLQTFVSLYGSWVELLSRAMNTASPWLRIRRSAGLLLLDAVLLAGVVIGASINLPALVSWLERSAGVARDTGHLLVVLGAFACALPFAVGVLGLARRLGFRIAELALPAAVPGKIDLAFAPRRALVVTLQIGIVLLVGIPLVTVTQPFLPPFRGLAVVGVFLGLLGVAFWRTATSLQGHVRAGAEMAAQALVPRPGRNAHALEEIRQLLPGLGTLVTVPIDARSGAVGRTLAELNMRGRTGATAVALLRGDDRLIFPSAKETLREGDVLALTGATEAITAASQLLAVKGAMHSEAVKL